jgi:hypothetical protein
MPGLGWETEEGCLSISSSSSSSSSITDPFVRSGRVRL